MKLLPTAPPFGMAPSAESKSAVKTAEGFQQALERALESTTGANTATSAAGFASAPAAIGLDAIGHPQAPHGIQRMERFIDALEDYQQRLDNPRCGVKDLAPSLERLEDEHHRLSQWAEDAAIDRTLKSIVNEGLVTATLEIHRFRSGQYC